MCQIWINTRHEISRFTLDRRCGRRDLDNPQSPAAAAWIRNQSGQTQIWDEAWRANVGNQITDDSSKPLSHWKKKKQKKNQHSSNGANRTFYSPTTAHLWSCIKDFERSPQTVKKNKKNYSLEKQWRNFSWCENSPLPPPKKQKQKKKQNKKQTQLNAFHHNEQRFRLL